MAIKITRRAVDKVIAAYAAMSCSPGTALRLGVTGGGCSGLSYKLEFDDAPTSTDIFFIRVKKSTDETLGPAIELFTVLEFAEKFPEFSNDTVAHGIAPFLLVADAKSYLYLNGVTLDWQSEGLTGGFIFINPNAKSSCGCGSSFQP